ncbi:hypothetical protein AVEN_265433-1 [Araneus ventricosus]|uniref:Uncharacterized protein n=1 Tax=Araneus ventricosus TaxID=182803 RepID=A0A4Y2K690_ARAVE|nr:hypothetical protein AVEN_265433-1 [Araneus ventricosus]
MNGLSLEKITERAMLSALKVFEPIGYTTPVMLCPKLLPPPVDYASPQWPSGRASASKPDSTEDRRAWGLLQAKSYVRSQTSARWYGEGVPYKGCQLRCRPRHLTAVQNDEIGPLVLLQNGTLM